MIPLITYNNYFVTKKNFSLAFKCYPSLFLKNARHANPYGKDDKNPFKCDRNALLDPQNSLQSNVTNKKMTYN